MPPVAHGGAHPRSRGEHLVHWRIWGRHEGSSPLARGAPATGYASRLRHGLIPARAGSTDAEDEEPAVQRAHPRSRGEHTIQTSHNVSFQGSSPLARGAPLPRLIRCPKIGLIPARAGSTSLMVRNAIACGAHPRSRGEHFPAVSVRMRLPGSSPLARGAHNVPVPWEGK